MKQALKIFHLAAFTCLFCLSVRAGEGVPMKCDAHKKDGSPCAFEAYVIFGGGFFFQQAIGFCKACDKFVYVRWRREKLPPNAPKKILTELPAKAPKLGAVWISSTGKSHRLFPCPHCKKPFVEIPKVSDLKHCPKCNQASFSSDPDKPRMAID